MMGPREAWAPGREGCTEYKTRSPRALLLLLTPSFSPSCWLNPDHGFLWSFLGPVTFIILVTRPAHPTLKA